MKNILFIAICIATLNCNAQSPIISMVDYQNNDDIELINGCYLKDVENKFTPFLGTWKWVDGNNEFTITFTKMEMVYDGEIYADYLIGKYKYIENGVEIINTLNYNGLTTTNIYTSEGYPYIIRGSDYTSDTYQYLRFFDKIKGKSCHASTELLDALNDLNGNIVATQMQWKLWNEENITINGEPDLPQGFSVPTEVILIKQ